MPFTSRGAFAFALSLVLAGLAMPSTAASPSGVKDVEISNLGVSNDAGLLHRPAAAGERIWGVGLVNNKTGAALPLRWTMSIDGNQVAFGGVTIGAGQTAVSASATTETMPAGVHRLSLVVARDAKILSQDTVNFDVSAPSSPRH